MSKRIALYYRVSTDDQSTDPQRLELQDYCQRKGWSVAAEYCDTISGAKFTRTGLDRLMAAVRKRKIDAAAHSRLQNGFIRKTVFRARYSVALVAFDFAFAGLSCASPRDWLSFAN